MTGLKMPPYNDIAQWLLTVASGSRDTLHLALDFPARVSRLATDTVGSADAHPVGRSVHPRGARFCLQCTLMVKKRRKDVKSTIGAAPKNAAKPLARALPRPQ